MENEKLVSVVIPCYNHEQYIHKTVTSVLNQSYSNIEVIVADDCSTDHSVEVLRKIQDPRLRIYTFQRNLGTVHTLNFLLKKAAGDYIAILGSDDYFAQDKLEKQVKVMEENLSLGAVFSWAETVDENDMPYSGDSMAVSVFHESNRSQAEWLRYFFEDGNHLCHSSALVRREAQETIGLYHAAYRQLHDFDWWLRLLCKYPIYIIQENLTGYRRQNQCASVSAISSANMIRHFNECSSIFLRLFKNMPDKLFLDAFADMLEEGAASISEQKYKVLRQLNFAGCNIRNAAQELFLDCIDDVDFFNADETQPQELVKTLYADTSKFAVEYPLGVDVLTEMLPELTAQKDALTAQKDALTAQNDALTARVAALTEELNATKVHCRNLEAIIQQKENSISWKITKPVRALSAIKRKVFRSRQ